MMICPHSLAFDVDGVIADTMSLFLNILASEYRIEGISYDDITSYKLEDCLDLEPDVITAVIGKILEGDYVVPLRPIDGADRVLPRLGKDYGPVLFVTARPHPGPILSWLKQVLSMEPHEFELIATGSFEGKSDPLKQYGITHFVDDRLETCFTLKDAGIEPIVFRQPWNRREHPFLEVGSWGEMEGLISWIPDGKCL
jgi:5'(3')-deoxyribonucleotidase